MALYGDRSQQPSIDPTYWYGKPYDPPAALDAGTVQQQISNRLAVFFGTAGFSDIAIYQFPKFDLDCWWASNSPAFVLIAYTGVRLSKPLSTSAMLQERTIEYDILVEARQTAWAEFDSGSVFALVWAIEQALSGFEPLGCRRLYFTDERFTEQDATGGIWVYRMRLDVITMLVKWVDTLPLTNLSQVQAVLGSFQQGTPPSVLTVSGGTITLPVNSVLVSVTPFNSEVPYVVGADYQFVSATGVLSAVPGGALSDGTQVAIRFIQGDLITLAP